jgi:hypothetical protein
VFVGSMGYLKLRSERLRDYGKPEALWRSTYMSDTRPRSPSFTWWRSFLVAGMGELGIANSSEYLGRSTV